MILNENNNQIQIINEWNDFVYGIDLADIKTLGEQGECLVILNIMDKSWSTTDLLYKIAMLIHRKFSDININWVETFFIVEKSEYLTEIRPHQNSSSFFKDIINIIEHNKEESSDLVNGIVQELTKKKLKEFNLI